MSDHPDDLYRFPATPMRVLDGDTVEFSLDLGFGLSFRRDCRLASIDTSETHNTPEDSAEHRLGMTQTEFVREWLSEAHVRDAPIVVQSHELDNFGRPLATVSHDGELLNERIVSRWPSAGDA